MKGIVFTEFAEMIEEKFGDEMIEDLIDETDPPSGGAYSAVGTYDHTELVNMVVALSEKVNIPVSDLVKAFGNHLAGVFSTKFASFFAEVDNTLDFLKTIDNHIHVEVAKLYPDADLPAFSFDDSNPDEFHLHYSSTRGLADLAEGLIEATAKHYNEQFTISRTDEMEGELHKSHFVLSKC